MKRKKDYIVSFYSTKHEVKPLEFKTTSYNEAFDKWYEIIDTPDAEQIYSHGVFIENSEVISQWCNPVKAFTNLEELCNM